MATKTETIEDRKRTFLPAAGRDLFLPLYDPFVKLFGGDRARKVLLDQANLQPDRRVLDIGCGTGTLVMQIKRLHPQIDVTGIDPDPNALARARRKAGGVPIQFDQGFSDELPYPDASFDRVLSSFMFHHLLEDEKKKTLREVRRVLKSGGSFHMVDFSGPDSNKENALVRWIHSAHRIKDNSASRILTLLSETGFEDPKMVSQGTLFFLHIAYFQAVAPAS